MRQPARVRKKPFFLKLWFWILTLYIVCYAAPKSYELAKQIEWKESITAHDPYSYEEAEQMFLELKNTNQISPKQIQFELEQRGFSPATIYITSLRQPDQDWSEAAEYTAQKLFDELGEGVNLTTLLVNEGYDKITAVQAVLAIKGVEDFSLSEEEKAKWQLPEDAPDPAEIPALPMEEILKADEGWFKREDGTILHKVKDEFTVYPLDPAELERAEVS